MRAYGHIVGISERLVSVPEMGPADCDVGICVSKADHGNDRGWVVGIVNDGLGRTDTRAKALKSMYRSVHAGLKTSSPV
jgi:hypothetical protein